MELKDFIKSFIWKSAEQLKNLRNYMQDFITYLARVIVAGNLLDLARGR